MLSANPFGENNKSEAFAFEMGYITAMNDMIASLIKEEKSGYVARIDDVIEAMKGEKRKNETAGDHAEGDAGGLSDP